jgi:hypothetical protein
MAKQLKMIGADIQLAPLEMSEDIIQSLVELAIADTA